LLLAGMFLASLALRPQLVGGGPLLSAIQRVLRVSRAVAGLIFDCGRFVHGLFAPIAFRGRNDPTRWWWPTGARYRCDAFQGQIAAPLPGHETAHCVSWDEAVTAPAKPNGEVLVIDDLQDGSQASPRGGRSVR
jgi:hypothetical protein